MQTISVLEDRGYRVSPAADETAMREALKQEGIEAVILDASMGSKAMPSLAQQAKARRIPVVMISGSDARMAYAAEHDLQLLHKPFRIQELCDALDQAFTSNEFGQRKA